MQRIIRTENTIIELEKILKDLNVTKYFLVCGKSIKKHDIYDFFIKDFRLVGIFNEYTSNPKLEDICRGVEKYKVSGSNCIICVGGGSSIDVAKCIKIFSNIDNPDDYLKKINIDSDDTIIAIPTTAGSGSESTKFAVVYVDNEKKSVESDIILPQYAILNSNYLSQLPMKHKVCTMMDAMCQSIEAWWSVNLTEQSIEYSKEALMLIVSNMDNYLTTDDKEASDRILLAANLSGRAINIAKTTATHAMSYKLTTLYNIPHGCSVAVLLPKIWGYMVDNIDKCTDKRGIEYLNNVFFSIANCFGVDNPKAAIGKIEGIIEKNNIKSPIVKKSDFLQLVKSVNIERLRNNPVYISEDDICSLYSSLC